MLRSTGLVVVGVRWLIALSVELTSELFETQAANMSVFPSYPALAVGGRAVTDNGGADAPLATGTDNVQLGITHVQPLPASDEGYGVDEKRMSPVVGASPVLTIVTVQAAGIPAASGAGSATTDIVKFGPSIAAGTTAIACSAVLLPRAISPPPCTLALASSTAGLRR
jgi:hypothetical protein